ncbi:unnamed protein product [Enterobius vermicularis]|uniref:Bestrophin homolog n=1 Tax=Enterobius vermicularis TaxID=51028 RepID=A0A0N4VFR6_ENTVE|nr:unnamed protein product [Enterobius vermicularis]
MTITYTEEFSTLLFQWRGSVWKAVLKELILFYILYYIIMIFQFFCLDEQGRIYFAGYISLCAKGLNYIPLSFLVGFFVAIVVARWWEQFNWISWPDKLMMTVAACFPGKKNLNIRQTLARWSSLQAATAWSGVSVRSYKRFPTEKHLLNAKLFTDEEYKMYTSIQAPHGKWFIPTLWSLNLISNLYRRKKVDPLQFKMLIDHIYSYRDGFSMLYVYDWIKIPLVYTQAVAIATYGYFGLCLIARQPRTDEHSLKEQPALLFPILTTFQIIFYLGWLKVGQYLMNPFGEDDDDFGKLNYILDRNSYIAKMMAVEVADQYPRIGSIGMTEEIPHTKASFSIPDTIPKSLSVEVPKEGMKIVNTERLFNAKHEIEEILDDS